MIVRVIGMKSAKSAQLMELVRTVMKELGISAAIEEINELNKMLKYPIKNSMRRWSAKEMFPTSMK
jgi:hypothetical protein